MRKIFKRIFDPIVLLLLIASLAYLNYGCKKTDSSPEHPAEAITKENNKFFTVAAVQ